MASLRCRREYPAARRYYCEPRRRLPQHAVRFSVHVAVAVSFGFHGIPAVTAVNRFTLIFKLGCSIREQLGGANTTKKARLKQSRLLPGIQSNRCRKSFF